MYSKELQKLANEMFLDKRKMISGSLNKKLKQEIEESTKFLDTIYKKVPLKIRCFVIIQDIDEENFPKCPHCKVNPVSYKKDYNDGFNEFCSSKCSGLSKSFKVNPLLLDKNYLYEERIIKKRSKESIANELGCSVISINSALSRFNILNKKENKKIKKLSDFSIDDKNKIIQLLENLEFSSQEISDQLGISNQSFKKLLVKLEILKEGQSILNYRYGKETSFQTPIQSIKAKNTFLEKYGVEYCPKEFWKKRTKFEPIIINISDYIFTKINYNPEIQYPKGTPFTYLIGWTKLNKFYYGVRYSKNCHPSDLWTKYFTSSIPVKEFRKLNGEPDIVKIDFIFNSKEEAKAYEEFILKKNDHAHNPNWLNLHNGGKDYYCNIFSEERKQKLIDRMTGTIIINNGIIHKQLSKEQANILLETGVWKNGRIKKVKIEETK